MAYKSGLHKKVFSIFDGVQAGSNASADAKTPATKQPFPPSQTIYPQTPLQQKQDLGHFPFQQVQKPAQELYKDSADKKAKVPPKSNGRAKVGFMQLYKKIQTKILPSKNGLVSNRQKASVVLIPVLCIVMFVVLFNVLGSPPPRKRALLRRKFH